jgi:hypothetical protein
VHLLIEECVKLDPLHNEWNPYKLTKHDILKKKNQLHNALCVINFSSTIVFEASFTATPIIQMVFSFENNFPESMHINQTLKNPHLKYLLLDDYPNICKDKESMRIALSDILQSNEIKYKKYSEKLQEFANPMPDTKSYKQVFCDTLEKNIIRNHSKNNMF